MLSSDLMRVARDLREARAGGWDCPGLVEAALQRLDLAAADAAAMEAAIVPLAARLIEAPALRQAQGDNVVTFAGERAR